MRILILAVIGLSVLAQSGDRDVPIFGGDGNPNHEGQPSWCQARDENGFKKNCGKCDHKCGEDNDNRCKTYCRSRSACRCNVACVPTGHMPKINKLDPSYKEVAR